jgi:hypothetical protein
MKWKRQDLRQQPNLQLKAVLLVCPIQCSTDVSLHYLELRRHFTLSTRVEAIRAHTVALLK